MSHFSCRKEPQVFHFFDYDFYKETMAYTGFRSKSPIHTESFHKRGSMHIVAKPIKLDWLNFRKMSISTTDIDCMWKKAYILRENHYHLKKKKKKVIIPLKWPLTRYPFIQGIFSFQDWTANMLRIQFNPWDLIVIFFFFNTKRGVSAYISKKTCISKKSRWDHKLR